MRYKSGVSALLILMICLCLLCGCEQIWPKQTTAPTETTLAEYSIKFMVNGEVYFQTEVKAGGYPAVVTPVVTGAKFYGWLDENGNMAEPMTTAVYADAVYYAEMYADLSSHEPYLFADKNRFLRPEDLLTADEMTAAITVLAVNGAESYLPELPKGAKVISVQQVTDVLKQLFPPITVEQLMTMVDGDTMTRADFTVIMNVLLGRSDKTAVVADVGALPYDLSASREDISALMEACYPHTHGEGADTWSNIAAGLRNPSGFLNADGWLYYVDENGDLARDTQVGELTFGADGRYTCGDAGLDTLVAEILAQIAADNPDAERIDLLRRAFEYSRDSFSYLPQSTYYFGQTGWEIGEAKNMLETKQGNCYSYAAVFWALGRGLGYETIAISGTMTETDQPHSWVEIYFDGVPYIFDPEVEMVYRVEQDIFDMDMFMVDYETRKYWNYKRP